MASIEAAANSGPRAVGSVGPSVREKVRIRFRKDGPLRFVGHNDLLRSWQRLLRRTGLPIRMSEGFHPKPVLSSPLSLALGIVGREEIIEFELAEPVLVDNVRASIEKELIDGLSLVGVSIHTRKERCTVIAAEYEWHLPEAVDADAVRRRADDLIASIALTIERRRPNSPVRRVDVRPMILSLDVEDRKVRLLGRVAPEGTVRPEEIMGLLGLDQVNDQVVITRSRLELA